MHNYYLILALCAAVHSLKLKQVVVLSRHSIRTPLVPGLEILTEKKWPTWDLDPGLLTAKGGRIERFMGKYFSEWLISESLLENNCPNNDEVFVYSNTKQRTKETANSFVDGAFGNCVKAYTKNITGPDPVFNAVIRNTSEHFKELGLKEMQKKVDKIDLREEFMELQRILEFEISQYCNTTLLCDLTAANHVIFLKVNEEPGVGGPLRIGYGAIDAFLMAYYEGMESNNIGFGELKTEEQWKSLMKILITLHDLIFKTNILNKDIAGLLIEYIKQVFLHGDKKFYLLVAHDANINAVLSVLNFKDYVLHDQFEKVPIGGKVVFQKWYDEENNQDFLRVDYVYQSTKQIRDGAELSLQNPPQWQLLEMEQCVVDENGFCPWEDFVKILKDL